MQLVRVARHDPSISCYALWQLVNEIAVDRAHRVHVFQAALDAADRLPLIRR